MNLYLIRHADAGDPLRWEGDDEDRPLTDLGRQQAKALAEAMRKMGEAVRWVVSSPLVRATQTAEELLGVWTPDAREPAVSDLLSPGGLRKKKLSRYLASLDVPALAIVGHRPDISVYLAWLLGTHEDAVPLAKGGAACLELPFGPTKGGGELLWAVTPEWFMPAGEPGA